MLIEDIRYVDHHSVSYKLTTPDIQLHCASDVCGGTRTFSNRDGLIGLTEQIRNVFLVYNCRNCNKSPKIFAIRAVNISQGAGAALKYGEDPAFGPPTPSRLISLVGKDREAFLKGRRCENQGLGIGAFAYYRRVVENQKNRLLDEILRVAERIRAPRELISSLNAAKNETQFSKAVELTKESMPQSLLIDGHNPMTLLHKALSEGLHADTDEACLELATSVRVILQELTEKTASALKDHAEIKTAFSRLLNKPTDKKPP